MSLAERLQRVRERRAARALGRRAALGMVEVIDLTERAGSAVEVDVPGPCPRCGHPGTVGLLDLHAGHGQLRCEDCGTSWEVPLDERDPTSR